jgi:phosphatidylserine/phosphatidylglycerophosphate/cardiolipin synthase-like enzyme
MQKPKVIIVGLSVVVFAIFALLLSVVSHHPGALPVPSVAPVGTRYHPAVSVYFSPHGGCTAAIVQALNGATSSIYLQAYSFTSKPISDAIVRDAQRGVTVKAILDHSQESERSSKLPALMAANIPVLIDHVHQIAHSKIIIIDGQEVITGSFNFSAAAENENAENLLILDDKTLAARYQKNWDEQASLCDPAQ